jgi:pSer/pThr/pTyr-binding forkhead associated (FHA) protein
MSGCRKCDWDCCQSCLSSWGGAGVRGHTALVCGLDLNSTCYCWGTLFSSSLHMLVQVKARTQSVSSTLGALKAWTFLDQKAHDSRLWPSTIAGQIQPEQSGSKSINLEPALVGHAIAPTPSGTPFAWCRCETEKPKLEKTWAWSFNSVDHRLQQLSKHVTNLLKTLSALGAGAVFAVPTPLLARWGKLVLLQPTTTVAAAAHDLSLRGSEVKLGLSEDAHIMLSSLTSDSKGLSRLHCRLVRKPQSSRVLIVDESTNGTWVNNIKLKWKEFYDLQDGDVLTLKKDTKGNPSFKFKVILSGTFSASADRVEDARGLLKIVSNPPGPTAEPSLRSSAWHAHRLAELLSAGPNLPSVSIAHLPCAGYDHLGQLLRQVFDESMFNGLAAPRADLCDVSTSRSTDDRIELGAGSSAFVQLYTRPRTCSILQLLGMPCPPSGPLAHKVDEVDCQLADKNPTQRELCDLPNPPPPVEYPQESQLSSFVAPCRLVSILESGFQACPALRQVLGQDSRAEHLELMEATPHASPNADAIAQGCIRI